MRLRTFAVVFLVAVTVASSVHAHDLFLKLDSYFVEPESEQLVPMLNGSFDESENAVTQDRVTRFVLAGSAGIVDLPMKGWDATTRTTYLPVSIPGAGTFVLGVSTASRSIPLEGKDFNAYLAHDGIPDILAARRESGELDKAVVEVYSKHVKAVLQSGEEKSSGWSRVLGGPAELVPLSNPYDLERGSELSVRVLVDGKPIPNQLVITGGEGYKGPIAGTRTRSDEKGVATFTLRERGVWFIKFIHMEKSDQTDVDYVSKWATLTFAIP